MMFDRIHRIWNPIQFHYPRFLKRVAGKSFFEGWYFKMVDAAGRQPLAVIPGVFLGKDAHCFLQVLDGFRGEAAYHRFRLEEFSTTDDPFELRIGSNVFSERYVNLELPDRGPRGRIDFGPWHPWPVRWNSPGAMGPYSFTPFMQCYHGILSMDHSLSGKLTLGDRSTDYDDGRGYVEKDWGSGFPEGYVWAQSNCFDRPGISVSASVAKIPWLTGSFTGLLAGLLWENRIYRFTTYSGARIDSLTADSEEIEITLSDKEHRLEINVSRLAGGAVLHAPYDHVMIERVPEVMTASLRLRLWKNERLLLDETGRNACAEIVNAGVLRPE